MSIYAGISLTTAISVMLLSTFVFLKNPNSRTNQTYALYGLSVFVWCFGAFLLYSCKSKESAVIASRITLSGPFFISVTAYHFSAVFAESRIDRKIVPVFYVLGLFFIYLCNYTDIFVNDVYKYFWGYYAKATLWAVATGILYYLFSARLIYILYKRLQVVKKIDAVQYSRIKYVFAAMVVSTISGLDYIATFGIPFYPPANILTLIMLSLIAYAIVRHKLMDIEVIIKKTLVFAGLLASVFAILVLPTLLIQEYVFRAASAGGKLLGLALSGVIIILSLRRIENFLINITDKYLFQKKYDYKELLKTFTGEVLTVVNLDKLVNMTVDKLVDIIKLNSCAVLLLDEGKQQFNVTASRNIKDPQVTLVRPDGIVTFLEQTHGYLLKKELIERKVYIPPSIQEIINKLNAELIIPMVLHSDVMGILALGKKKSDEDYNQDDLDILLPLARTLAIAISNARLFDELGKAQAEAAQKEKMAVIGTLSAGINHEICNPLGIARGQCEAFLLNVKDGLYDNKSPEELLTKAKDIMAKVIKETDRATAITKKLSSFAKPAKGEAELVNIDKEVDDVQGLVGYELKLEKIEFEKRIPRELPNILVDRKQFQEVLFNLIRNAGQAIGEKGKISVIAKEWAGKVYIDIKDTGSGIPEDKMKELFNPFFTTKEPGKGTGLGLFIVRQVVEKNGGKIYLKETKVGEGTTFTIEFPIAVAQESKV